jgi:di/tricarboxylate transporter
MMLLKIKKSLFADWRDFAATVHILSVVRHYVSQTNGQRILSSNLKINRLFKKKIQRSVTVILIFVLFNKDVILLFFGSLVLAKSFEMTKLHERVSLKTLIMFGTNPK